MPVCSILELSSCFLLAVWTQFGFSCMRCDGYIGILLVSLWSSVFSVIMFCFLLYFLASFGVFFLFDFGCFCFFHFILSVLMAFRVAC